MPLRSPDGRSASTTLPPPARIVAVTGTSVPSGRRNTRSTCPSVDGSPVRSAGHAAAAAHLEGLPDRLPDEGRRVGAEHLERRRVQRRRACGRRRARSTASGSRSSAISVIGAARRCRSASKHSTEPAIATLSDSDRPSIGIVSRSSTAVERRRGEAVGLAAEHERDGTGEVDLVVGRAAVHDGGRPGGPRARPAAPAPLPRHLQPRSGTWNSAPADARTHFALLGSTELPQNSTAAAPGRLGGAHAACRRCPGSATSTSTSASGPAAAAASASSTATSTRRGHGRDALRRDRVGGRAPARRRRPRARSRRPRRPRRRRRRARRLGEHLLDHARRRASASASERRAVDHEATLLQTRSAAPREAPQPLHAGVPGTDRAARDVGASGALLGRGPRWPPRRARRTPPARARRGRRGPCGRPRSRRAAGRR